MDESGALTLENIRDSLIRQEDSIIFNLIERTQYKLNLPAYDKTAIPVPGFDGSLMEFLLRETEILHGKVDLQLFMGGKTGVCLEALHDNSWSLRKSGP